MLPRVRSVLFFQLPLLLLFAPSMFATSEQTLVEGDVLNLRHQHGGRLVLLPADDPIVQLQEVHGADAVVRITPIDAQGNPIGGGRLFVLNASEKRVVRLRNHFAEDAFEGTKLRVEVLEGGGRIEVRSTELEKSEPIQPDANAVRRRVKKGVSGAELLDLDEASGKLSSETALLYRVYSLFQDARLPAQYQGGGRPQDSLYMAEVNNRFRTLSPEMQALVQPFLTPPIYAGSWANAGLSKGPRANASRCDLFGAWVGLDTENSPYTVWFDGNNSQDETRARQIINAIDREIYTNIANLLSPHRPLSDGDEECNGGDGRLDIFVSDIDLNLIVPEGGAIGVTQPYEGCKNTPAYIVLRRNASDSSVAHEIFHGFQFSYDLQGCLGGEKYGWWTEASAEWAEDFVYKEKNEEHSYASFLLDRPEEQLDLKDGSHEYGAYLLPFFVHRKTGTPFFVGTAWKLCEIEPALEAVNDAIPGGFKAIWPEFVRAAWNRKPDERFQEWDNLDWGARLPGGVPFDAALGGRPDAKVELQVDLPLLSATYKHFKFTDDGARTVVFWNGVTSKLEETAEPLTTYQPLPASQTKPGDHVWAFIKIGGQWKEDDWTERPSVTFCRDQTSQRIEELVIIISNAEFMDRDRRLRPEGLPPVLWVSNMGCYQWKGSSSKTGTGDLKIDCQLDLTFTRAGDGIGGYEATGSGTWRASGNCSGEGTLSIGPGTSLSTYNLVTGGRAHRGYNGGFFNPVPVFVNCSGVMTPLPLGGCFGVPGPDLPLVDRSGTIMEKSFTAPGFGTISYRLTSTPQP
ncbi:MAG: hypothetical protein ABI718_09170 [Acidobacteriota bacterium]